MPQTYTPLQLAGLRKLIVQWFNSEELKNIAEDSGLSWGSIPGATDEAKVGEMVRQHVRKQTMQSLLDVLTAAHEDVQWIAGDVKKELRPDTQGQALGGKARILFLGSNPSDTDSLNLAKEVRSIEERLRASEHRDKFEFKQVWATRATDLIASLLQYSPTVVHFSGHGTADGELVFEDADGEAKPVAPAVLVAIFKEFPAVRLVTLNACYSAVQAAGLAEVVPVVIGNKRPIGDTAAGDFSAGLYMSLAAGRTVKSAFQLARAQIQLGDSVAEDRTPKILFRADVDQDKFGLF